MARITTPFDYFVADVTTWLDQPWYVWTSAGAFVAISFGVVRLAKWRSRVQARIPHYKRQSQ